MKAITTEWIAGVLGAQATENVTITSVVIDTRKIVPGCLFVCIRGERFDGNEFAQQAVALGAAAVLCTQEAVCSGVTIRVADTRGAFLQLAAAYRDLFRIPLVGLTGSVGKTTTKEMTHLVLSGKYQTLKTQGNFNNEIGLPQTLFCLDDTVEAAVIEMGMSDFGEIRALAKAAKPTLGIITNIGLSHIEHLGSQAGIFQAKMELTEGLQPGAPLVVNGDDPFLSTVRSTQAYRVYTYGIHNGDFRAVDVREQGLETRFRIVYFDQEQAVCLPAIGLHHVYDALAAFAAGYLLGVDGAVAAKQLAAYVPDGMRQKCVDWHGVLSIEDCYNAAPDSMRAALTTLQGLKARQTFAVLADMLELGDYAEQAHRSVGEQIGSAGVDVLLAYGPNAKFYIEGAKASGCTKCFYFTDKRALCAQLCSMVHTGDAVLFKGSRGMKLEEVIEGFYEKWGNNNE